MSGKKSVTISPISKFLRFYLLRIKSGFGIKVILSVSNRKGIEKGVFRAVSIYEKARKKEPQTRGRNQFRGVGRKGGVKTEVGLKKRSRTGGRPEQRG